MAFVPVPSARFTAADTPEGMRITIPVRRNWFIVLFVGGWLIAWVCGWVFVPIAFLASGFGPESLFLIGWWIAWTAAGGFIGYAWLNQIAGREIVTVDGTALTVTRQLFRILRSKSYEIANVKDLRISRPSANSDWSSPVQAWGIGGGAVSFDYGSRTIRFGVGLDEAEAKQLVQLFHTRLRH
jgi:hypothetical protein